MNFKSKLHILGVLSLVFMLTASCSKKDDTPDDPAGTITLNMANEQNGKTILGNSDMFINNAGNFQTETYFIADAGSVSGLGVSAPIELTTPAKQVAVKPGHLYQLFSNSSMTQFPSGAQAISVRQNYYKIYAVSHIKEESKVTGAVVKYVLAYPNPKGLPEDGLNFGTLSNRGETIEIPLSKGTEYMLARSGSEGLELSNSLRKLIVKLTDSPNEVTGPWGDYNIHIRSGGVYSTVNIKVR